MGSHNNTSAKYSVALELAKTPEEVFSHLINLKKWWPEEFEGETIQLYSEFVFTTGDSHYSKNRVIEFVPNSKLAWLTTESIRKTDHYDWTGTRMIFELLPKGAGTLLTFTYDGVVLENESERLVQICDMTLRVLFYNFIASYATTIEVSKSPHDVFRHITGDVAKWWGGKDYTGSSTRVNDEFVIHHSGAHYSKQKLIEVIPDKKVVWLVTESTLDWLHQDKQEWTDSKMIFEIAPHGARTVLHFTHQGLVPEKECYLRCSQGWHTVIKDYLFHLITGEKPHF